MNPQPSPTAAPAAPDPTVMNQTPNLMSAEGQQAHLFDRLDRLFNDSPDYVVNDDENICCTKVGEWLMDHEGFAESDAFELAFEWANQPKYAQYSPTRNL